VHGAVVSRFRVPGLRPAQGRPDGTGGGRRPFQRLDQRLAAALLGNGPWCTPRIRCWTDQLGTAREIITPRLLQRFERAGHARLARERIEIADAAALREPSRPVETRR
jgi:hypothetical protein